MKCIRCGKETNNEDNYCNDCVDDFNEDIFSENETQLASNNDKFEKLSLDKNNDEEQNIKNDSKNHINLDDNKINLNKNNESENNEIYMTQKFSEKNTYSGNFKYCVACGEKMHASAKSCNNCGIEAGPLDDNGNLGIAVAGCCVPIIGFVIYFVWRDTRVKSAKQCLIGAIIGTIAIPVLYLLFIFITTLALLGGIGF